MRHNQSKVLVIDDDPSMRDACREILTRRGYEVELAEGGPQGLGLLGRFAYDVILLDLRMPDSDGISVLKRIIEQDSQAVVIVISGHGSIEKAVESMKLGAFDFVRKPFTPDRLRSVVSKALEQRQLMMENFYLKEELRRRNPTNIIHKSPAMNKVMDVASRVAATDATVLLTGESGTGKGLLARTLHELSSRRGAPMVSVDCSTLVPTLFESELFGHVKGAFTGADKDKIGKFELAGGGTLFLDEVGNISMEIQAKLLKAVEDRAICKVGSNRIIRVDTRLIAATNRDLSLAVRAGEFRQDLFYRLNVVHLQLPPLRERPEDVPMLADYFLDRFRHLGSVRVRGFSPAAMERMAAHAWPGNVRELENVVQRLVVLATDEQIDVDILDLSGLGQGGGTAPLDEESLTLSDMERLHIRRTMRRLGGRRGEAARLLGIDRKTLRLKLRRYDLEEEFA